MTEPHGTLTVAFGIDERFAVPCAATLSSFLCGLHGEVRPNVYILSESLRQSSWLRLQKVAGDRADLTWLRNATLPLERKELVTSGTISTATYYRVILPELLPRSCKRFVYLDADTIVQGNLQELWNQRLDGNVVGAARDQVIYTVERGLSRHQELGISPDQPYFNAGVLIVDTERWRDERITERFVRYQQAHARCNRFWDQDGLNAVLHDRWCQIDARWNLQTVLVDGTRARRDPARSAYLTELRSRLEEITSTDHIIHFTQGSKPWHPRCPHPHRDLFRKHLQRSGFFSSSLSLRTWYMREQMYWAYAKRRSLW